MNGTGRWWTGALCGALSLLGAGGMARAEAGAPKVFMIVMENRDWSRIAGNAKAPYLNGLLARGAHAERYYTPPHLHPSEPNYLWLEAGDNFGVTDGRPPRFNMVSSPDHLVTLLEKAGRTWKSYQEDIPGDTCPLERVGKYAPKHNPMVFFRDVTDGNDPRSARCIAHVRPYEELEADLEDDDVADYNFLTPNLCHDMHDTCGGVDPIAAGDAWLAAEVPKILASKAYQEGAVVFITWDEGDEGRRHGESLSDGPIGLIVLSKSARAGYASTTPFTHSSTLRTVEEILGVQPFLGDAARAHDLSELFTELPRRAPERR